MSAFPTSLNPEELWNYQHYFILRCIYQTLVRINESGRIVSDLARTWEINEGETSVIFHLDVNSKFHNGENVKADDVAYSIARHFWPGSKSTTRGFLSDVLLGVDKIKKGALPAGIKILDSKTIQFKLKRPYPPFLQLLAIPAFSIQPKNIPGRAVPPGSGPMIAVYDSKQPAWHLKRNPNYKNIELGLVEEILVVPVVTLEDVKSKIAKSEVDLVAGLWGVSMLSSAEIAPSYSFAPLRSIAYSHLFLNNGRKVFSQPSLREDLAGVVYRRFKSLDFSKNFLMFEPFLIPLGVMPFEYYKRTLPDMDASAFKEKWKIRTKDQKLSIVLRRDYFPASFRDELKSVLSASGFRPEIRLIESSDYISEIQKKDYDIFSGAYFGNVPDPDGFITPLLPENNLNYGNLSSADFESGVEKIRFISPPEARLEAYVNFLKAFESQWKLIPMFRMDIPMIAGNNIRLPQTNYRYEIELYRIRKGP